MRIIAGIARGQRLLTPKGSRVRPTADRIKEALFSILTSRIDSFSDLRVLDIFAGTGNLGIEALSRGAGFALFVDAHRESALLVKKNLELARLADRARVVTQDALSALKALALSEPPFHLVFLDPPYREGHVERVLGQLAASPLLTEETVVVAEFHKSDQVPERFGPLGEVDRRVYGDTVLSFLMLDPEGEES